VSISVIKLTKPGFPGLCMGFYLQTTIDSLLSMNIKACPVLNEAVFSGYDDLQSKLCFIFIFPRLY